ncbi:MAG TPA: SRPBCC family protein [Candidatus Binataceae bacterium]
MSKPKIVITTYLASTPDKVWKALTDPEITQRYWFGTRFESDWKVGSRIIWRRNGKITDEQVLLKSEPSRVLSYTFHPVFSEEYRSEPPSKVTLELEAGAGGEVMRLTMTHDEFPEDSAVYRACSGGWPQILSSLKTLLETGKPLPEFRSAPE